MTDSHKADAYSRADVAAELKLLSLEVKEALRRSSEKISDFWMKPPSDEELRVFEGLSDSDQIRVLDAILGRFSTLKNFTYRKGAIRFFPEGIFFLTNQEISDFLRVKNMADEDVVATNAPAKPLQPADLHIEKSVSYLPLFQEVAKHGFAQTNGEARRLVRGGGIWVNGKKATDENMLLMSGDVVSMCHDTPKKREFTVGVSVA